MTRYLVMPALLLVAACSSLASAERITVEYSFVPPKVEQITIGANIYHRITMAETPNFGQIGHPALPARGAHILLPLNTEAASIEIVTGEEVLLGRDHFIEPVARPVTLSSGPGTATPPTPDSAIYALNRSFPESLFERIGTYEFRGYQIVILRLQPVQYNPTTGELSYYSSLTVIVETVEAHDGSSLFRGLAEDGRETQARVDNPEIVDTYATGLKRGRENFELLILTTPSLAAAFQPLKDFHDTTGILTEIRTTDDVGSNAPDDVRDYIRNTYLSEGIKYVLIGADDDLIPAQDLYVRSYPGGSIEYYMPADLYFGCLDGTYNHDGDSYWGEPLDGDDGGPLDLIAEVYVGRATVGDATEADRFVSKTIAYLTSDDAYLQNVLMAGEYLGFGGVAEYAGNALDEMIGSSMANGYSTYGIPEQPYTVETLYDRDWPGNDWPQSEMTARINNGLHIISHFGHGNTSSAMKFYKTTLLSALTNDRYCFVYSQACLAGHFDGTDCWAEYMTIKGDHGAFAVIMNARSGWGVYESTDGASQRFNREFWDAVFNPAESKTRLGWANQRSKEDNLYRIDESCMRWCYYELTLFGDPTIPFWGADTCIDGDGDEVCNVGDNCPQLHNPDQADADNDGIGDVCDECTDVDGDGYGDPGYPANTCAQDNCPSVANVYQRDADGDGIGDACDTCTDVDQDGFGNPGFWANRCPEDNCPNVPNPDQLNADGDGLGDACDACTDTDNDGYGNPGYPANSCPDDNCPSAANPEQLDPDGDELGSACDNCPEHHNPDQSDSNQDGIGDACCCVHRGNVDGLMGAGGAVDVADLTHLVVFLFQGGEAPPCLEQANADGIVGAGGPIDVADLTSLVGYLFRSGPEPPPCP